MCFVGSMPQARKSAVTSRVAFGNSGGSCPTVIARTDEDCLVRHKMRKGAMQLIDEARAARIYDAMGPAVEVSGGSAANTVVGVAALGLRAAFIGRVKDDELGRVFAHDI